MTTTRISENINNLTSVWATIGQVYKTYSSRSNFAWVDMKNKTWPNRLWLNQPLSKPLLKEVKQVINSANTEVLIPHISTKTNPTEDVFKSEGFLPVFHQIGMSLELKEQMDEQTKITLKPVTSKAEAEKWSLLFEQSFGYFICSKTIENTCNHINYYISYIDHNPIGTLLLHSTNSIIGAHALGIIPEMRRNGYAEQIMKRIINQAIEDKKTHMTLQASEMGKNIYTKLGFETDFILNTYKLGTI